MAKEETVLQGIIDKLIETGRYYGMEMNVEKTNVTFIQEREREREREGGGRDRN